MHTHIVFFWLNDDLGNNDHDRFEKGLKLLASEPHVLDHRIGTPAATERDVVDSGYSFSIVLRFSDLETHNAYQVSSEHQVFLDTCFGLVDRVQVYDVAELHP